MKWIKNKQTNVKWIHSLYTMREEGQSFSEALLWQKQLININNKRIRIQLGANPFLLLYCIEIKNKEKNRSLLKPKNQ